jgi:hypothetical protein
LRFTFKLEAFGFREMKMILRLLAMLLLGKGNFSELLENVKKLQFTEWVMSNLLMME